MILGFGILSKAVSSPEILRFKVAIKCGTFATHFVPSYDQSGEREPWPRNYQTLTNTPSSLRSLGVINIATHSIFCSTRDTRSISSLFACISGIRLASNSLVGYKLITCCKSLLFQNTDGVLLHWDFLSKNTIILPPLCWAYCLILDINKFSFQTK